LSSYPRCDLMGLPVVSRRWDVRSDAVAERSELLAGSRPLSIYSRKQISSAFSRL